MFKALFIVSIMILIGCGRKSGNAHLIEQQACSVKKTSSELTITCPDGSKTVVDVPKDGRDGEQGNSGSSCSVEQLSNGAKISCTDGTFAYIYNGKDGEQGAAGTDGSSCSVSGNDEGAEIKCTDGSLVNIKNGTNGSDGSNGQSCTLTDLANGVLLTCGSESAVIYDGEDALAGAIGIAEYVKPCGDEFNGDEILLRLTDGNILALYDGGPHEDRLVLMYPGTFITTDRNKNKACQFTLDADLNIINEKVL